MDTRQAARHVDWPAQLEGGRCLDVGTFDGFWAFEMERRGAAEVIALDVDDPATLDWPYDWRNGGPAELRERGDMGAGFAHAAAALGASARRVAGSIYALDPEVHGRFDVVCCGALLLHLRDPVRALERVREVCAGELVLIETLDPVLEVVAARVPAARVAPHRQIWWRVNTWGMLELLDRGGFEVTHVGRRLLVPNGPGQPPPPWINSLAALRPRERGNLHRVFRARPRPPVGG
jgi:tRNA (mo5U34)-methyltransferase